VNEDKDLFDTATLAPDHVRFPAVPLAYQSSPFIPGVAPEGEVAPTPPPREVRKAPAEPWTMLDLVEPPETYGLDEVTVLARDPWTIFCWWEATEAAIAGARVQLGSEGALVLRMHVSSPAAPPQVLDVDLGWNHGRRLLGAPRSGAVLVAAIGIRCSDGRFGLIARAPRCVVPPGEPTEGPVEWMEVAPATSGGRLRERPAGIRQGGAASMPGASELDDLFGLAGPSSPSSPSYGPTSPSSGYGPSSPVRSAPTSPTRGGR
jgi:hypothetical protein